MTNDYQTALATVRQATSIFRKAQADYRSRKIGDSEFIKAKLIYSKAQSDFDVAFDAEQAGAAGMELACCIE